MPSSPLLHSPHGAPATPARDAVAKHTFVLPVVRPLPRPVISSLVDRGAW
ncbi:MAG TPA: hypothetical protein VNT03_22140 [Baekduia sp.]|nr:hypothetical protein [Baekduia sp.]